MLAMVFVLAGVHPQCRDEHCYNGGTCVVNINETASYCVCDLGYRGNYCGTGMYHYTNMINAPLPIELTVFNHSRQRLLDQHIYCIHFLPSVPPVTPLS